MSDLVVQINIITEIKEHPNADRLEIACVKGWETIVRKDTFKVDDWVIFIPPDAILPERLHAFLGITNYCAELPTNYYGDQTKPTARRVKAARLRGYPSYGTVMSDDQYFEYTGQVEPIMVGMDVADKLGITKWEPPVKSTQGDIAKELSLFVKYTDIQNWRNYPDIINDGEEVVITEKIHGTNLRLGYIPAPNDDGELEWQFVAGSHVTNRKEYDKAGRKCLYWEPYDWCPEIKDWMKHLSELHGNVPVIFFAEIYGDGVQDMKYGHEKGSKSFAVFDVMINGQYVNYDVFKNVADKTVPVLYRGPFSKEKLLELTNGPTTICSDPKSKFKGREGVVVKPVIERTDPEIGRVILKSVSVDYLERRSSDSH